MLHVGLDLSRRRVDVCLISDQGELVDHFPVPADRDGLYWLTRRVTVYGEPVSDLFGVTGRKLLDSLDVPEPWRCHVDASLLLIDQLERQIVEIERELKRSGADHRYVPLLLTAPGIGWVLARA
jgi:hypothetical protein